MLFDPGAATAGKAARWGAAMAFAALLCLANQAAAQDDDLDNETPIVAQPSAGPTPIKKHHHRKRLPPDDPSMGEFNPGAAVAAPPPPAEPAPATPTAATPPAATPPPPPPPPAPIPVAVAVPQPEPFTPPPAAAVAAPPPTPQTGAPDSEPWSAAVLMERACADRLRHNEEDRLYGLISFNVRSTLGYAKTKFTAEQIDDTVQDSLDALIKDCGRIIAADRSRRLSMVIDDVQTVTARDMEQRKHPAPDLAEPLSPEDRKLLRRASKALPKPTAADLSQELTSSEIDAWLDGLPPLQRALALFQYASDVTPKEVAAALGIAPLMLKTNSAVSKTRLLTFFHEQDGRIANAAPALGAPMQYRPAGIPVAGLLAASATPDRPGPILRITGISSDLFAGWSLLAVASGLPPDKGLDIAGPIMLVTDGPGPKRMIAVATAEITRPDAPIRRYLIKAYTVDGDTGGAGFRDTLHLAAAGIDNAEALKTLRMPGLANIEIARCLWHDYGRGPDPGLCR